MAIRRKLFAVFLISSYCLATTTAAAAALPSPAEENQRQLRFSRVVIMHNDRPNRHIRYMFEPLVRTLLEGFKHFEVPVAYVIVEAFKCRGQCMRGHFHRVRRGEMLIWVGNPGRVEVPWRYLRDKGVYSVYYQSEPRTGGRDAPCHLNASVVDELWDYSWFNLDRCGGGLEHPPRVTRPLAGSGMGEEGSRPGVGLRSWEAREASRAWAREESRSAARALAREESRARASAAADAPVLRHLPPGALEPSEKALAYTRRFNDLFPEAEREPFTRQPAADLASLTFLGSLDSWSHRAACWDFLKASPLLLRPPDGQGGEGGDELDSSTGGGGRGGGLGAERGGGMTSTVEASKKAQRYERLRVRRAKAARDNKQAPGYVERPKWADRRVRNRKRRRTRRRLSKEVATTATGGGSGRAAEAGGKEKATLTELQRRWQRWRRRQRSGAGRIKKSNGNAPSPPPPPPPHPLSSSSSSPSSSPSSLMAGKAAGNGTASRAGWKSRLVSVYNLWSEEAWQAFLHQPETGIFININKGCRPPRAGANLTAAALTEPAIDEDPSAAASSDDLTASSSSSSSSGGTSSFATTATDDPLPYFEAHHHYGPMTTFRNAQLLNARALVISEFCYRKDQLLFEGLVNFVDVGRIPQVVERLLKMTRHGRQKLAEKRARLYKERFKPSVLFEKAGIPDLLFIGGAG